MAEVFTVTHPSMFLPDGANVVYAAEIKKHVKTPVATVGAWATPSSWRRSSPRARPTWCWRPGPSWPTPTCPRRRAPVGRRDQALHPLLRVLRRHHHQASVPLRREPRDRFRAGLAHALPADRSRRRSWWSAGGVAGMQAALTAAERGHEVILCEKSDRLGGVLRCEERVPFKRLRSSTSTTRRG